MCVISQKFRKNQVRTDNIDVSRFAQLTWATPIAPILRECSVKGQYETRGCQSCSHRGRDYVVGTKANHVDGCGRDTP